MMRIAIIPNLDKPDAVAASRTLAAQLASRATIMLLDDPAGLNEACPDLMIVLGGDGSILRVAHAVCGLEVPVVGINFGKLGYLAAFSMNEFLHYLDVILAGRAPMSQRLMLEGAIYANGGASLQPLAALLAHPPKFRYNALNDIVVNAGQPFRMIELHVRIDEQETTTFRSDGVIVSTSSGSTGYNLSAGGPLISPDVHAMVLTPICPHSLSFRPVVLSDTVTIVIHPHRVNPGTRVSFDGQVGQALGEDECVIVRRAPKALRLIENPGMSHWRMLASKLQWAQSPRV